MTEIRQYQTKAKHNKASSGPTFIKPDQRNPWIKDQLGNDLLSTICTYSYQILCHVGGTSPPTTQNLVTVGAKL